MKIRVYAVLISFFALGIVGLSLQAKEQDYTSSSHAALAKVLARSPKSIILEARIDLQSCYDQRIRDPKELELFLAKLCARLKLNDQADARFIVCDGSLMSGSAGSIFMQIADDMYIVGRVIHETNAVQLTLSGSLHYNAHELADFAKKYFGATSMDLKVAIRK